MAVCPVCNQPLDSAQSSCPSCGFHLLGATEEFNPIKVDGVQEVEDAPQLNAKRHYHLRIVRGPSTGIDIPLHAGTMSVGRDPRSDVFLNDMTVSREHAGIEVAPSGCIIRDKNSVNGVWVNDRMVEACSLKQGDLIQIGSFCLSFHEVN